MSIANKALLANLHICAWAGRKLDKQATQTVETSYSTDTKVGNYTKKLLPAAAELDNIARIAKATRMFFYEQTLPWCTDGSRILSSKNYMEFAEAFRARKEQFDRAVSDFLREYPRLREDARHKLGNLFREGEYPTVAQLSHAFTCEISFMPVPDVSDFRVQVSQEEKDAFLERMREVETNAMRECWTRLHDTVAKAASKLSAPDAIFRDSLIENIRDMCKLLPKLNVTDDPKLEAMRQDVERIAYAINPDACRDVQAARGDAAAKLSDITARMGAFMGAV